MKLPILAKFVLASAPLLVASSAFAYAPATVGTFTCGTASYPVSSFDLEETPFGGIVTVGVPLPTVQTSIPFLGASIGSCTLTPSGSVSDTLGGTYFIFSGVAIASAGAVTDSGSLDGKITFSFTSINTVTP